MTRRDDTLAVRRLLPYALAVLAVTFSFAFGGPPPKQPPEPGIAVAGSL
jgi:hypothetical protein